MAARDFAHEVEAALLPRAGLAFANIREAYLCAALVLRVRLPGPATSRRFAPSSNGGQDSRLVRHRVAQPRRHRGRLGSDERAEPCENAACRRSQCITVLGARPRNTRSPLGMVGHLPNPLSAEIFLRFSGAEGEEHLNRWGRSGMMVHTDSMRPVVWRP